MRSSAVPPHPPLSRRHPLAAAQGGNPVPTIVAVTAEELELDNFVTAPPK
jgi:hypothetical protein